MIGENRHYTKNPGRRVQKRNPLFTIMCAMNATPKAAKWREPPPMDPGDSMPAIYSDETGLTCAYVIGATHSESGSTAILHFEGVLYYAMGYPNDEALKVHPLYANGLGFYDFHLVENSPLIADLDRRNQAHERHVAGNYMKRFRHWVITFHDETLEVVATKARFLRSSEKEPGLAVREHT
jgi:hypothetical protein